MRELRRSVIALKDRHDKSEITATKYVYQDKYGILHASDFEDYASQYGNGVYVATDEVATNHGYAVINGVQINLYGGGKGYVYTSKESKNNDIRLIVSDTPVAGGKIDHANLSAEVMKAYKIASEFYVMLK